MAPTRTARYTNVPAPRDRREFEVAILCALPLEASAVSELFEESWEENTYGKAPGDPNAYSIGSMGCHKVVLVHMPNMGKVAASTAAAWLRASYPSIQLALVVGICGGVPSGKHLNNDIFLGDVVISEGIVQYDLGRQYPNSQFARKDTPRENLSRPRLEIRTVLAKLRSERARDWLRTKTAGYLDVLRETMYETVKYPAEAEDVLFYPTYCHQHHSQEECNICSHDSVCDAATILTCEQLKCSQNEVVSRVHPSKPYDPAVHFGLIASGDTVMKSGQDRDEIATRDQVIAFEMEGAGVWESFPYCLIIKGVCDYADSHKSKGWQNYAAATAAAVTRSFLELWTPSVHTVFNRTFTSPRTPDLDFSSKENEILRRLDKLRYQDRKDRNPDRTAGTCDWFVAHELFQNWKASESSKILWVSADPGCGKSVLAKYLADTVISSTDTRTTCYFFFKEDVEDQGSVVNALCCILHQLFRRKRYLLTPNITDRFETTREDVTDSFSELWEILVTVAQDENAGEIICILDAIDECESTGRSQLIKALCKLYSVPRAFNLKFLVTSRPYAGIRQEFHSLEGSTFPYIHLSGESDVEMKKISQEIDVYIKARVLSIAKRLKLKSDEEKLLLMGLTCVPNRTYLWVHLTLDMVESDVDIDRQGIVKSISHLPKSVDETYERILSKSRHPAKARELLHIVVAATRPLTLNEMNVALTLGTHHRSYHEVDLMSEERFRENVRDLCGFFITIIDSRIYLFHQTAKEFLVRSGAAAIPMSIPKGMCWKYSLEPQESHALVADICIHYLLLKDFDLPRRAKLETAGVLENHEAYVFLDYAAKNWTTHYHKSKRKDEVKLDALLTLCDVRSTRCLIWLMTYWASTRAEYPVNMSSLIVASYFGLKPVVRFLMDKTDTDLNAMDDTHGRTAISWAAETGFDDITELLITGHKKSKLRFFKRSSNKENMANVNSNDRYGRTPLFYAVWHNHTTIVKQLLHFGARPNIRDEIGGTLLFYAGRLGYKAIVEMLLTAGAEVDSADLNIQAVLFSATLKGHDDVIRLLLANNPFDSDLEDEQHVGATPLWRAMLHNRATIVKLLVSTGNVNSLLKGTNGQTSLSYAATYGQDSMVKLLLETGRADPDCKNRNNQTPLSLAARKGQLNIVKILLETGKAELDSKDNKGQTPLSWAARNGHTEIVHALLDTGKTDPDSKDNDGQTPLSWAARNGRHEISKALLDTGKVNPESKDTSGWTPLRWAAENGHDTMIKWLLEMSEVQMCTVSTGWKRPFLWAVKNGHDVVVRRVLATDNVDPDVKDGSGRTALWLASEKGHDTIVRLLLQTGKVTINFQDDENCSPLLMATKGGHEAVVKSLLAVDEIDANLWDDDLRTPICWAARNGHTSIVKLLLEMEKLDLNLRDSYDWSPIRWAEEQGHTTIVKMLLETGRVDLYSKDTTDG